MSASASTGSATLRLGRDRTRSKDRRRPYTVFVDGYERGELRRGGTTDIPVAPGAHIVDVAIDFDRSTEWQVYLSHGDVVTFACRSRGPRSDGRLDLFLADPGDPRARLRPSGVQPDHDPRARMRVVTRDGQVMSVWAHRSGYLRSLDPGSGSGGGDEFVVELAYYVLVLPVLSVIRWIRHRLLFNGGWSVGVVRKRRCLWPKKVRLERFPSEADARARVPAVVSEVENWPVGSVPSTPLGTGRR